MGSGELYIARLVYSGIGTGVRYSGHRVSQGTAVLGTRTRATGGLELEV